MLYCTAEQSDEGCALLKIVFSIVRVKIKYMKELFLSELSASSLDFINALSLLEKELFLSNPSDIVEMTSQLDLLVSQCQGVIEGIEDPLDRADRLIQYLYIEQLMVDTKVNVWPLLTHRVASAMRFYSIAPTLKSMILMHVIRRCGFTCEAVFVPDELMLRIVCNDEFAIIFNVVDGKPINWYELEERVDNVENQNGPITLEIFSDDKLVLQYLVALKTALIREVNFECALKCIEIILALTPDDPYHRRDRGFLLQQLDCYKVAFDDYQYFVEQCPQDPAANLLEQQLKMFNQVNTVLH